MKEIKNITRIHTTETFKLIKTDESTYQLLAT